MCVLSYHRPALKPLPPGLYMRLLALKVSRYLYYKISLFMSNFAKGNNRKNIFFFKSSLGYLLIILCQLFKFVQSS